MANLVYPDNTAYSLPKKTVLVISCMDLRLTDNLLEFLHYDNLANRYDHFILAGASLCATHQHHGLFKEEVLQNFNNFTHWSKSLQDHLQLAVMLHDIQDVYIVEHRDCGAYTNFLKNGEFDSLDKELESHRLFAKELSDEIYSKNYLKVSYDKEGNKQEKSYKLNVHCFLINLRGDIELLHTTTR